LVLGEAGRIVVAGAAAGVVGALLSVRAVSALLFNTAPDDPVTYLATLASLIVVAMAASIIPARRASRVDPITALRTE
jgi:ABC-type antimicrobial peptide transport system permease subunit